MFTEQTFKRITKLATVLAFIVITLGAYVRLSDAGLGCPDWPGCYGKLTVPVAANHVADANAAYPDRPVKASKAWKEMIHRYLAGTLGILVLAMVLIAWVRRKSERQPVFLPLTILVLIIIQALLGMWTVTLLLKPVIVMAHLLGGMTIFLLLSWLVLRSSRFSLDYTEKYKNSHVLPYALIALLVVYLQISLGGWTSANYAALICPDFPTCRGEWIPPMDIKKGFTFWTGLGKNYEFGLLDAKARTAIHMAHRLGAFVTFTVLMVVSLRALFSRQVRIKLAGVAIITVLGAQIFLGIMNIKMVLPIHIAVAHNGVAALLLITVGALVYYSAPKYFIGKKHFG